MQESLAPPVTRYLEELEKSIKAKNGVVPEDALDDARSHLERFRQDVISRGRDVSDDDLYARLVGEFGAPSSVAEQYEAESEPLRKPVNGYAPAWRIYCTKCGRSAPAAQTGVIKIGARSWHEYTLGWCSGCKRFRWLRLQRDLNQANFTKLLGKDVTPKQLRASIHVPAWKIVVLVLAVIALIELLSYFVLR